MDSKRIITILITILCIFYAIDDEFRFMISNVKPTVDYYIDMFNKKK